MTVTSSNRGQYRRRRPRSANRPTGPTVHTAANRARIARVAEAAARHGWYDVALASLDTATVVSRSPRAPFAPHVVRYAEDGTFRVVERQFASGRALLRKIGD